MEKRTEKNAEEKDEKQELKAEEADLVAGSAGFAKVRCPSCGSHFLQCMMAAEYAATVAANTDQALAGSKNDAPNVHPGAAPAPNHPGTPV